MLTRTKKGFKLAALTAAFMGFASPAFAASYYVGDFDYSDYCGTRTFMSVFSGNATEDGSAKVDFDTLKVGGRTALPSGCAGVVQFCVDLRITQHTKGSTSQVASTAPFGGIGLYFDNYSIGFATRTAQLNAYKCIAGNYQLAVSFNQAVPSGDAFIWTGGRYAMDDFRVESRPRFYSGGAWHYGTWSNYYKDR